MRKLFYFLFITSILWCSSCSSPKLPPRWPVNEQREVVNRTKPKIEITPKMVPQLIKGKILILSPASFDEVSDELIGKQSSSNNSGVLQLSEYSVVLKELEKLMMDSGWRPIVQSVVKTYRGNTLLDKAMDAGSNVNADYILLVRKISGTSSAPYYFPTVGRKTSEEFKGDPLSYQLTRFWGKRWKNKESIDVMTYYDTDCDRECQPFWSIPHLYLDAILVDRHGEVLWKAEIAVNGTDSLKRDITATCRFNPPNKWEYKEFKEIGTMTSIGPAWEHKGYRWEGSWEGIKKCVHESSESPEKVGLIQFRGPLMSILLSTLVNNLNKSVPDEATRPTGCTSDSQCKGNRICVDGECVSNDTTECTFDTQCPGDQICKEGSCID